MVPNIFALGAGAVAHWKTRVARAVQEIVAHLIVTLALLLSFKVVDLVYEFLWGKDALVFGLVPFKWLIQIADVCLLVVLGYTGVRSFYKAYKE